MAILQINTIPDEAIKTPKTPEPDVMEVDDVRLCFKVPSQKPVKTAYTAPRRVFKSKMRLEPVAVKTCVLDDFGTLTVIKQPHTSVKVRFDVFNEDGVQLNEAPLWDKPTNRQIKSICITWAANLEQADAIKPEDIVHPITVKCATKGCAAKFEKMPDDKTTCCKDCLTWLRRIALPKYRSIRYKGSHYTIGGSSLHGIRGSGGEVFRVVFKDGHTFDSGDVWNNGQIPKRFKAKLPDNVKTFYSTDQRMMGNQ